MNAEPSAGTTIPGIAHPLPPGERLLWVGAPDASRMARDAMHVRVLAAYFFLLLVAPGLLAAPGTSRMGAVLTAMVWVLPLGVGIVLFARTLGAWTARTTVYAITERRVVIKAGIALPTTFNIPLHIVETAAVRANRDGSGDVALSLEGDARIAWLLLWPHVRPWRFARPHPMLRGIDHAAEVGKILATAIRATMPEATVAAVAPAASLAPVRAPALGRPADAPALASR